MYAPLEHPSTEIFNFFSVRCEEPGSAEIAHEEPLCWRMQLLVPAVAVSAWDVLALAVALGGRDAVREEEPWRFASDAFDFVDPFDLTERAHHDSELGDVFAWKGKEADGVSFFDVAA